VQDKIPTLTDGQALADSVMVLVTVDADARATKDNEAQWSFMTALVS
jgi:hypothetical protein